MVAAVPAQAVCWTPKEIAAAKVRDMETMLMVSALRCRFVGGELLNRYNAFVTQSRPVLVEVNEKLREHFTVAVGNYDSLDAYDNYVTAIANRYGAGAVGLDCADMESITDAALGEGMTFAHLAELADRAGVDPAMDDAACQESAPDTRWDANADFE